MATTAPNVISGWPAQRGFELHARSRQNPSTEIAGFREDKVDGGGPLMPRAVRIDVLGNELGHVPLEVEPEHRDLRVPEVVDAQALGAHVRCGEGIRQKMLAKCFDSHGAVDWQALLAESGRAAKCRRVRRVVRTPCIEGMIGCSPSALFRLAPVPITRHRIWEMRDVARGE